MKSSVEHHGMSDKTTSTSSWKQQLCFLWGHHKLENTDKTVSVVLPGIHRRVCASPNLALITDPHLYSTAIELDAQPHRILADFERRVAITKLHCFSSPSSSQQQTKANWGYLLSRFRTVISSNGFNKYP